MIGGDAVIVLPVVEIFMYSTYLIPKLKAL